MNNDFSMQKIPSLLVVLATSILFASSASIFAAPGQPAAAGDSLVLFDGSQSHSGIPNVDDPEDAGRKVGSWKGAPKGFRFPVSGEELDLSGYTALGLRLYSAEADGHGIVILADSNEAGAGNYFSKKITVDWKGWKTLVIPFDEFKTTRKPAGWGKIDKIHLANNGYEGTKFNPDAVYYVDEVKAVGEVSANGKPEDDAMAEPAAAGDSLLLFDGSQPHSGIPNVADPEDEGREVAFWKDAPKSGRLPVSREQLDLSAYKALSLRFYSAEADGHGIVILADSNGTVEGSYFQKKFIVDWKGWKTLVIPFDDFSMARKPAGWQKIDSIHLANNGYEGTKANKQARYYLDEVRALKTAPERKKPEGDESTKLTPNNSKFILPFPVHPEGEHIYGIRYELKGKPESKVRIHAYTTWDAEGKLKESNDEIGHSWQSPISDGWEEDRLEILTKNGVARVDLTFTASGDEAVEIRNVEMVEGGFPENPPHPEAPYVKWIQSLEPDLDFADTVPLLNFAPGGDGLGNSRARDVYVRPQDEQKMVDQAAPYLALSVPELVAMVPKKRPFRIKGQWDSNYTWSPDQPDFIFDKKTGERFDYGKKYPVQGVEKVLAPSGKTVEYAYHDSDTSDPIYKGRRIYVDMFQTDARSAAFMRAGSNMAALARKTGNVEYGVRAAAIIWEMARNMPDWPVTGQPSWNSPPEEDRMRAPDYTRWFSFVMAGNWYVTHSGALLWPARYFDLIRSNKEAWDLLAERMDVSDPREQTAEGLLHIVRMMLKRDAYYRANDFVFFHNLSGSENRSLIQLGRVLGIPDLVHYGMRKVEGTFRKRFMSDGVFPESMWYTMDQYVRQSEALDALTDYRDPEGYTYPADGTRLDVKNPTDAIPTYGKITSALARQTYPDGTASTVHDSWSETANPYRPNGLEFSGRDEVEAPSFQCLRTRHPRSGHGAGPDRGPASLFRFLQPRPQGFAQSHPLGQRR